LSEPAFIIEKPSLDLNSSVVHFTYRLGDLVFAERLILPDTGLDSNVPASGTFKALLDLTAVVLGVSYYKLRAPFDIDISALALPEGIEDFIIDLYENGLGEFFARNDLKRYGKLKLISGTPTPVAGWLQFRDRALVLIGGGKDSLVSVDLLTRADLPVTLFAVNAKGPIVSSAERSALPLVEVRRILDPEMVRLGRDPGYYNGHVPSTAINSMIASLIAVLFGYNLIVLSNERSASEGNMEFDGREANHQYSKSLAFEKSIRDVLAKLTGGGLGYFSLLRPYSEARIGALFARTERFDDVFSSCNENFKLGANGQTMWCCNCPKCHFVALIMAPFMTPKRLSDIQGKNVLDMAANIPAFRELTGLSGHKPWECVGEILEAAACLWRIAQGPQWSGFAVVAALAPELEAFYGSMKLQTAFEDLMADSTEHLIPSDIEKAVAPHAH
jgi:UDP-N-acetyl-alpha-D-muramoyl-L-alanyl-L-glutamate epimerase